MRPLSASFRGMDTSALTEQKNYCIALFSALYFAKHCNDFETSMPLTVCRGNFSFFFVVGTSMGAEDATED